MSGISSARIDLSKLASSALIDEQPAEYVDPVLRPAPAAPARRKKQKSPLTAALTAVGIILAILAAQLGLSIALSQGAYEKRALEIEKRDLGRVERLLSQNVDKLSSPQNLAENAAGLGMVQNVQPATLRLSDGAILGSLESVATEAPPNLVPNSTLVDMPVVDAAGLLVPREAVASSAEATRLRGNIPAPVTH